MYARLAKVMVWLQRQRDSDPVLSNNSKDSVTLAKVKESHSHLSAMSAKAIAK